MVGKNLGGVALPIPLTLEQKMLEEIAKTLPHSMEVKLSGNEPSLEDAIEYINNMQFTELRKKLSQYDPLISRVWSEKELLMTEQYYKNFLYLNKKYRDVVKVIVPSLAVDEFWHHHILDTRSYIKDSNNIFGYYFHHYPYFGMRSDEDYTNLKDAFNLTQEIYEAEFGEKMVDIW
ncbi:glycine-rich domain-containing protein [Pantoea agglomerans]|uniref:glycine-rich domain-containing protein n=1 Tax=Enterobacter agglomerans TaxID=549 RepID=UPI001E58BA33|nr:glycine-rich domain-containing protein-like [Pantoea agglomerans]